MLFIAITVLIDMIAIGLIFPVLPHLVGTMTDSARDQTFWFGVLAFTFGIANFVGAPVLGALSDRFGRRPVLLLGIAGLALGFFVTGLATALWVLVLVRLFSGAGLFVIPPACTGYPRQGCAPRPAARRRRPARRAPRAAGSRGR